jgi:LmbE family N-acetylglucosaminyl deacetylase
MVIAAHADDAERLGAGTMLKYKEEGYETVYVTVTNNVAGCLLNRSLPSSTTIFVEEPVPHDYPAGPLETMEIRNKEAIDAATILGAKPIFLNFWEPDFWPAAREIVYVGDPFFEQLDPPGRHIVSLATRWDDALDVVVKLFDECRPEIVISHMTGAEKHDHGNTGYLVYLAFKRAMERGIVGQLWMYPRGGWVEDALWTERLGPDVVIDVTPYVEKWYEAWNAHVSQKGYGMYVVDPNKKYERRYLVILDATRQDAK